MAHLPNKHRMNTPTGKEILGLVRNGDYAHPGEEESLDMLLYELGDFKNASWLDMGCGRGGTSDYIRKQGADHIIGFDRDQTSIEYARNRYPRVRFDVCEIQRCGDFYQGESFDFLLSINVFHLLTPQQIQLSFEQLHKIAHPDSTIIISEYTRSQRDLSILPFDWTPLYIPGFREVAASTGWKITQEQDISEHYKRWYTTLVSSLEQAHSQIVQNYGPGWFNEAIGQYSHQVDELNKQTLGGVVLHLRQA